MYVYVSLYAKAARREHQKCCGRCVPPPSHGSTSHAANPPIRDHALDTSASLALDKRGMRHETWTLHSVLLTIRVRLQSTDDLDY